MNERLSRRVTRRQVLGAVGAAGVAVAVACDDGGSDTVATPTGAPAATPTTTSAGGTPVDETVSCVVSPEQAEGPFFVDEILDRSDIRSDPETGVLRAGVPLRLVLTVQAVNGDACTPLDGAVVDVWHCDAEGLYSDAEANGTLGEKFLRGYQLTDESGTVGFTTIYPGWYTGRAVHIHAKVRTDPSLEQGYEFTSQLYFDEAVNDQVHARPPYDARGSRNTMNSADMIYGNGGDQLLLALTREGDGYVGTIGIGVRLS